VATTGKFVGFVVYSFSRKDRKQNVGMASARSAVTVSACIESTKTSIIKNNNMGKPKKLRDKEDEFEEKTGTHIEYVVLKHKCGGMILTDGEANIICKVSPQAMLNLVTKGKVAQSKVAHR
jgi:hypothetical protein